MNEREQLILKAIIKHYLDFGESVGSRTLEKKYNIGVSSATIRNTMADLEDKGLIVKTHTSSGRIPTSEGYRLYVEELLKIRDISQEEKEKVFETYNKKKINQIDEIFEETSRLLSKISQYAGVVLEPSIRQESIRKVQFVHINDTNVLAVVVMDTFLTKSLNIYLENPVSEEEVDKINNFLNEKTKHSNSIFTLSDLKEFLTNLDLFIPEELEEEQNLNEGKLFFEGSSNLFESNDIVKIVNRAKLFNSPNDLKNIFSQFIQMDKYKDGEVNVIFGEDLGIAGLEDFSFVFSVYTFGDAKGMMGVIGPKRMEYSKTVGLVEYVSEEVQHLLKKK